MNFSPIGDIAQSLMMRRRGNSLRQELSSLTQELATGQSRDLGSKLRGNFSTISAIEHSIKLQDGFSVTRKMVEQVLTFSQQSLGAMQSLVDEIGPGLLAASSAGTSVQADPYVARGPDLFRDLASYANTQHAGRYVFAGAEFGTQPISDPEAILIGIQTATAGMTSASDVKSAISDYFDNPASGFQTVGYAGGEAMSGAVEISSTQSVSIETTAKDQEFRNAFKHAAALALIARDGFGGTDGQRQELLQSSATGLIDASKGFVNLQAKLGASQQRLDTANSQASQEVQMLTTVKNDVTSVDPYEVATKLEAAQTQLESLYLVTARTARLNLSEYLR